MISPIQTIRNTDLVDAAGFDLVVEFAEQPEHLRRLSGPIGRRVRRPG